MALDLGAVRARVTLDNAEYMHGMDAVAAKTASTSSSVVKMLGTAFGALGVAGLLKSAAQSSMDFGAAVSNIRSIAPELGIEEIKKSISDLPPILGRGTELAEGFYYAYSAGARGTADELAAFTGEVAKTAKAVRADLTPTMDAATTIMNAYGMKVGEVNKISDILFQIVKQGKTTGEEIAGTIGQVAGTAALAGMPLEEMGAALATLTRTLPTSMAVTSLNNALLSIIQPTTEASQAAKALGIDLSAAGLKAVGFGAKIAEINAKAGDNVEAITAMFGNIRAFRAVATLAGEQAGTFAEQIEIFNNSAGGAMEAFEIQTDNLAATWSEAMVEMGGAIRQLGDAIAPAVEKMAQLISFSSGLGEAVKSPLLQYGAFLIAIRLVGTKVADLVIKQQAAAASASQLALAQQAAGAAAMKSAGQFGTASVAVSKLTAAQVRAAMASVNATRGLVGIKTALTGGATGAAGLSAALGNVALAAGVAFVGWEIGRRIGEATGLTDAVNELTAKLYLLADAKNIAAGDAAREATQQREINQAKKWADEIAAASPEIADEVKGIYDGMLRAMASGDESAVREAGRQIRAMLEQVRAVAQEEAEVEQDPFAFMLSWRKVGGTLADAIMGMTEEQRKLFQEQAKKIFELDDITMLAPDEIQKVYDATMAVSDFALATEDAKKRAAGFQAEQQGIDLRFGQDEDPMERLKAEYALALQEQEQYLDAARELQQQARALEEAGLTEEAGKVRAALQQQLDAYRNASDEVKDIKREMLAPFDELEKRLESFGGLGGIRKKLLEEDKGPLEEETVAAAMKTFSPEDQKRIDELTTQYRGMEGMSEKDARDMAIRSMSEKLERQGKDTAAEQRRMVQLLEEIAASQRNREAVELYVGSL